MKVSYKVLVLFLGLCLVPLCADTIKSIVSGDANDNAGDKQVKTYSDNFPYQASTPINIHADGFSLVADSGSLLHDLDISVAFIPYKGGTPLPSDMENVTGVCEGVRLLPNGEHFSEDNPARITLSYNPDRLPMGYEPNEIYTYYCDDASRWHRLQRVAIDTAAHTVTSLTTHFTDFANAVIKVPEMPESKAFVPTMMTDLPDPDPMKGVPMIAAPTPNNRGTAELTYPIELPKGRNGLQPNVDLHYSSAGGNGILGVGWSLNTPAITIDTRWGVPRYDPFCESEQYLVNGAQILLRDEYGTAKPLPYQDTTLLPRTMGAVRFYARDTKNSDRIIRYGTNPTDYYWAVTDKNGVTTYYGRKFDPKNPEDNSIDENSVIRTSEGNIAYWAATATVDVFYNYILYTNEKSGNNICIHQIDYTGNCYYYHFEDYLEAPTYRINFTYSGRPDDYTNGRLGVLQTEDRLLCNIVVQYINPYYDGHYNTYDYDNLAAYYMHYNIPDAKSLFKSRLESIVMLDSIHDIQFGMEILNNCNFDREILDLYYADRPYLRNNVYDNYLYDEEDKEAQRTHNNQRLEEIKEVLKRPYGENSIPANVTMFEYGDAVSPEKLFSIPSELKYAPNVDLSKTQSTSWGLGGTATIGVGPDVFTTLLSGGGNYDYSRSKGECKTLLLDMNGDGLTDIIYEKNGEVYCKLQSIKDDHTFTQYTLEFPELNRLSREVTNTHTWGLQLSLGVNLSYSNPISTTYTDSYFADVNADGLPDFINNGNILINQLHGNIPEFKQAWFYNSSPSINVNNSSCGKNIILTGNVDERIECEVKMNRNYAGEPLETFYKTSWSKSQYADLPSKGKKNNNSAEILPEEVSIPSPSKNSFWRIEDDRVYLYTLECKCDTVKVDPEIETVKVWVVPEMGIITIYNDIALQYEWSSSRSYSQTADGVDYSILYCPNISEKKDGTGLTCGQEKVLRCGSIKANDYAPHKDTIQHKVSKGDIIMFRLRSGENSRFDKTKWHHIIKLDPIPGTSKRFDSEKDFVCTGDGHFSAYNDGKVVLTFSGSNNNTTSVSLTVRKNQESFTYTLPTGKVNISPIEYEVKANDSIFISLDRIGNNEPCWSDVHVSPCLQYTSLFPDTTGAKTIEGTITYYPDVKVNFEDRNKYPATSAYHKLFGPIHKGWGQFAYKRNPDDDDDGLIHLDKLVNTQLQAAEYASKNEDKFRDNETAESFSEKDAWRGGSEKVDKAFKEGQVYNPIAEDNYWVPMRADSRTEQYIAYGNLGCIGKSIHSNAREISSPEISTTENIVEYDSSLPSSPSNGGNKSVRKKSRSVQNSFSWGAIVDPRNQSLSFGTYDVEVDYMDMNGDGYPDFVGKGAIQYSMPWGGIGQLVPIDNLNSFHSTNSAGGHSFSASSAQLEKIAGNNVKDGKFDMTASMGVSVNTGNSSTKFTYMDVNADGLPDQVNLERGSVRYNLGYKFTEKAYPFKGVKVNEGENISVGANGSAAFSIGQVSISGGVGYSRSESDTKEMLIDINGDGLPDKLNCEDREVAFNKGDGDFDSWKPINIMDHIGHSSTDNVSTTVGVNGGFTFCGIAKVGIGIQATPYTNATSVSESMFCDMNGDGYVDYVYKGKEGGLYVCYNQTNQGCPVNLLRKVTSPNNRLWKEFYYSLSEPSSAHRNRQWNLKQVYDYDYMHPGAQWYRYMTVSYEDAYYDNFERTDYGYKKVRTVENGLKTCDQRFNNQSMLKMENWKKK